MSKIGSHSDRIRVQIDDRIENFLSSRLEWIVLVPLLLGFALRLNFANSTYLNPDEALHHVLVNQNTLIAAYKASLTNAHPPLYFVLLYYWRFLGNSEVMLRLPSVLASSAVAWMAYRWVGMVLGKAAGLITLVLLALSPVLTTLGAEVRNYSLLLLCMISALYFIERALRDQRVSSIFYGSLFLYLAILTHYSALWFVLASGIYVLLRIASLKGRARIAWLLFQSGGVAIYAWLYVVHISKIRGSQMEADAMTDWLQPLYLHGGESSVTFVRIATRDLFRFLFGSRAGGNVVLVVFAAGILWLCAAALFEHRRDLAAFGILLQLPFVFGVIASLLHLYPYGGTRHCIYLIPFATAGVSFPLAKVLGQRLLPILILSVVIFPYWYEHRLPDSLEIDPKQQRKALMSDALRDLRSSVQSNERVFSDYQSSLLLAYYIGRDQSPPNRQECGGVTELQYGSYHIVIVPEWSATASQLARRIEGWRRGCVSGGREPVWIFDAGWGLNLLDDFNQTLPSSISQARRYGETISLFKLTL